MISIFEILPKLSNIMMHKNTAKVSIIALGNCNRKSDLKVILANE